jgi:hypothetical protein
MNRCRSSVSPAFLNFELYAAAFRGGILHRLSPMCASYGGGALKLGQVVSGRRRKTWAKWRARKSIALGPRL